MTSLPLFCTRGLSPSQMLFIATLNFVQAGGITLFSSNILQYIVQQEDFLCLNLFSPVRLPVTSLPLFCTRGLSPSQMLFIATLNFVQAGGITLFSSNILQYIVQQEDFLCLNLFSPVRLPVTSLPLFCTRGLSPSQMLFIATSNLFMQEDFLCLTLSLQSDYRKLA